MKIVVLAGGLSTERDVSLASGAGICRTLRERGHEAFLLDVYLGFPYDADKLEKYLHFRALDLRLQKASRRQNQTSPPSRHPEKTNQTASSDQM